MKHFVAVPNLPKRQVDTVAVSGELTQESEYALNKHGISCVKTPRCAELYDAVAYHADMVMCHAGNDMIICEPVFAKYLEELNPIPNICLGNRLNKKYPLDIAYNAARVGDYLICNEKYTQDQIIEHSRKQGITIINVNQGYAKCNVCIIDERSIITSDAGIASSAKSYGIDVLFIDDSDVRLKGFSHGFFGGATGKIAPDKLAVNGNIKRHKFGDEIQSFTKKHDVEIISLNNGLIEDIGSILPIFEKYSI